MTGLRVYDSIIKTNSTTIENDSHMLAGKKILLVEDDKFFSELIAQKMKSVKIEVAYAPTGDDAIPMLQKDIPDVVLLDLMLPGNLDGFGVLEHIRGDEKLKGIPVIIVSNLSRPEDIDRCMKLGAFRYLVKASIIPSDIIGHITSVFTSKVK